MSQSDAGGTEVTPPSSERQKPTFNAPPSGGGLGKIGGLFGILAIIALVLSVAAAGIAFSKAPASQSPAEAIVTATSNSSTYDWMGGCAGINGANISITVPGAGTVAVEATVSGYGVHASGSVDQVILTLSTSFGVCPSDLWSTTMVYIDSAVASENFAATGVVFQPFVVGSAGTYTFHVNGDSTLSAPGVLFPDDWFSGVIMSAVFYPS
jgi:hypothetical protein